MKRIKYIASWRGAKEPVEIISDPPVSWFDSLEHKHARFALLADGDVFWGDGYYVTHKDICSARKTEENRAILVGVLQKPAWLPYPESCAWLVGALQYFMGASSDIKLARKLLQNLFTWRRIENKIGPFIWLDHSEDMNRGRDKS